VPNSLRWQAGQAHHLALGAIGSLELVTVSGHAGALTEPITRPGDIARGRRGLGPGGVPHGAGRPLSVPAAYGGTSTVIGVVSNYRWSVAEANP
jgi:hypothetical protein